MKKTQAGFPVGLGIPTILMIFIVLCLTTLGVLSLTSANSDSKLTDKTEAALLADYQAERIAEQMLSEIDGCLLQAANDTAVWQQTGVCSKLPVDVSARAKSAQDIYTALVRTGLPDMVSLEQGTVAFSVPLSDGRSLQVSVLLKNYQESKRYEITRYRLVTPELINEEEVQQLWPGTSE